MAGYIGSKASVVSSGAERKKTFAITGTTTVLTGLSYTPTFVHLFHNGVRLVDGTDYTATDGTSITLTSAAESGDEVVVISYASFQVADAYTKAEADAGFVSDPNGAVTVDGGGNVGIGTASPSNLLSLYTAGAATKPLMVYAGSNEAGTKTSLKLGAYLNGVAGSEIRAETHHFGTLASTLEFLTGDAERMRIDTAGRVTTPYQPFFKAYSTGFTKNVGWEIIGGSLTTVPSNIGGHLSAGRFTAPVAGVYLFSTGGWSTVNNAGVRYATSFSKNGSYTVFIAGGAYCITDSPMDSHTQTVQLNVGDYVDLWAYSPISATWGGGHSYWWSGYLIG